MKRTNLLLLPLFLIFGAIQQSNTAQQLLSDEFIKQMDEIFQEHEKRQIEYDIADFIDISLESEELSQLIFNSQKSEMITKQMQKDWQTLALILDKTINASKKNYTDQLAQAFSNVNIIPQNTVWQQPLLFLIAHRTLNLNDVTPQNFNDRINTLKEIISYYENPQQAKTPSYEDLQNFHICLTGLMIKSEKLKSFPLKLSKTLQYPLPLGRQNKDYTNYLKTLSQVADGLESFLSNGGALTFDLYRAYCSGEKSFEKKLKNIKYAAQQNNNMPINTDIALRFAASIATRLAEKTNKALEKKGWTEFFKEKAQNAVNVAKEYVMPIETAAE